MDFQQLLAKMNELDQPAAADKAVVEEPVATDECGDMPPSPMGMSMPKDQDAPPPSMSINLNAQGLDNIEELMNLIKAVNKDMGSPMPSMSPGIEIEPMDNPMGMKLGNLDSGPLKMLPDLDKGDNEPNIDIMNKPDDSDDGVSKDQGDLDNDGDHDMDDHDMEKKQDKEEAFGNSLGDSEPDVGSVSDAIPDGNDLNKPKQQFRAANPGDNPMAMEGEELRSWIKSELQKKLAEAKGAK